MIYMYRCEACKRPYEVTGNKMSDFVTCPHCNGDFVDEGYPTKLYLIEGENGLVKIGISKNVNNRLGQIASQSPVKVRLIAYGDVMSIDEQSLHTIFANKCSHGEWFSLSKDEVMSIIKKFGLTPREADQDSPGWYRTAINYSSRKARNVY